MEDILATVFTKNLGDFSLMSQLIVERTPCDQLGGGCTCEDCTQVIIDAVGLDPDHVFENDCERV